jgi:diguanylate cyclase (GGDEF)-like protein
LSGYVPYAPLLIQADKSGMFGSTFWFWSMIFFLLPYMVLLVVMFDVLVTTLKTREAEVRYLSEHDPLTGLYNRRSFNQKVEKMLMNSLTHQQQLSILLLDLDHFKNINDTYGHLSGDHVLVEAADILREVVRHDDLIGRFGGEEFVVVLAHSSAQDAERVAERIRLHLMALDVQDDHGRTIVVRGSLGFICETIGAQSSWVDLIHKADQALYRAKQSGRNRVVQYSEAVLTI